MLVKIFASSGSKLYVLDENSASHCGFSSDRRVVRKLWRLAGMGWMG